MSVCRWPKKLAEQVSPRGPQLPGGSQLCFCAHWSLLRMDQQGAMLLNVKPWGDKNEEDGHTRTHTYSIYTHTHTLTDATQTHTHLHHMMEYEEDPVSAVYCTHGWRRDTDDRYKLIFKLSFPPSWSFDVNWTSNACPMPLRIDTIYKAMFNVIFTWI